VPPPTQNAFLLDLCYKSVSENIELRAKRSDKKNITFKFDMMTRQKIVLGSLQATHAYDFFFLVFPIDGLDQHMSQTEYHTILRYRLMIALFHIDEVYLVYRMVFWILLGSIQFIVTSFLALSPDMTLFGMSFLIYSCDRPTTKKIDT